MIPIDYVNISIYLNLISRFQYKRLMIPLNYIGINIYLNLISRSWYGRLMIPTRFFGISMNMKGIYENKLDWPILKNKKG